MDKISLSVLILGFPPSISWSPMGPKGALEFVVNHYPGAWDDFCERMKNDFNVSEKDYESLNALNVDNITDKYLNNKMEIFVNTYTPSHYRTLKGISDTRDYFKQYFKKLSVDVQIIFPMAGIPNNNQIVKQMADEFGVELINLGNSGVMDIKSFFPRIRGDYLWFVPGGSEIIELSVKFELPMLIHNMDNDPSIGMAHDGQYSVIFRVSALKKLASETGSIPTDTREIGIALERLGYHGQIKGGFPFCRYDDIFGGEPLFGGRPSPKTGKKSFFKKLFGR